MKKLMLLSLVLLASTFTYAQEETVIEMQYRKGPYVTNRFFDNMFVSIGGGAQVYMGEFDHHSAFSKRIAPAMDFSLGKWVTPSLGLRLQYAGLKAYGWSNQESVYVRSEDGGHMREKFDVMNIHADALWNISNAIGGYRGDRFWDLVPYAGFGVARSSGNSHSDTEFVINMGLLNVMRISNSVDLNLEARMMLVDERFDGVTGGRKIDGLASVTAGITYNFPVRGFQRASDLIVVDDNTQFISTISDLERQLAAANAARAALKKSLDNEKAKAPVIIQDPYAVIARYAVFFNLGKADISRKEMVNLEYLANAIKQLPDEHFILFASADKETGSAAFNKRLSEKRGKAVFDVLTSQYGVNPDQLEIHAVGDTAQEFPVPALNRVVIVKVSK
jgi:outer membrane protein OmpA-like peptidoglycan-associated protein